MADTLGARLRQLRRRREMTGRELAGRLGVSPSTVSQYESDSRCPSDDVKKKIAEVFGVSVDYLLGLSGGAADGGEPIKGMYLRMAKDAQEMKLSAEDIEFMMSAYRRFKRANEPE